MGCGFCCKFCGGHMTMNHYSAGGGYCEDCRSPAKLREKLVKATDRTVELSHKLASEELKTACLADELEKYKPKPDPCTRCQCPKCVLKENMAQMHSVPNPYNYGGHQ